MKNLMTVLFGMMVIIGSAQAQVSLGGGSTVGGGNPAGQFCSDNHGTSVNVKDEQGNEIALCSFGRGLMEEWSYFHYRHGTASIAVTQFFAHPAFVQPTVHGVGMANPASVYCAQLGGTTQILDSTDGQLGQCVFSDRSSMEEWTLFRGPSASVNSDLVNALGAL